MLEKVVPYWKQQYLCKESLLTHFVSLNILDKGYFSLISGKFFLKLSDLLDIWLFLEFLNNNSKAFSLTNFIPGIAYIFPWKILMWTEKMCRSFLRFWPKTFWEPSEYLISIITLSFLPYQIFRGLLKCFGLKSQTVALENVSQFLKWNWWGRRSFRTIRQIYFIFNWTGSNNDCFSDNMAISKAIDTT